MPIEINGQPIGDIQLNGNTIGEMTVNGTVVYTGQRDIARDQLLIELDMANSASYPGNGTDWFDISGNNYHMNVQSGASLNTVDGVLCWTGSGNAANGTVDGTVAGSGPAATPTELGVQQDNPKTVVCIARVRERGSTDQGMFDLGTNGSVGRHYNLRLQGSYTDWRAQFWQTPDYDFSFDGRNQWVMYSVTYRTDQIGRTFVNNANLVGQDESSYSLNTSGAPFRMGEYDQNVYWEGDIAYYAVYGKGLSDAEIQQNYQALKDDYNLQ